MKKVFIALYCLFLLSLWNTSKGQSSIVYAEPNQNDLQRMNFEIIGKSANNILIYKEVKGRHWITVYDENMRELENVPIRVLPSGQDLLDVTFYPRSNYAWMLFQYQDGNVVSLEAARVEANGHILESPVLLDTTRISYKAEGKIYNHFASEDGNRIMLMKINRKNRSLYQFTTKLYDDNLDLLQQDQMSLPMNPNGDYLTGYSLDQEGNLVFVKYNRLSSGDIAQASLMIKAAGNSNFKSVPLQTSNLFLDDIKLRIDDKNQRYLLNSFYSAKKRGNIAGVYNAAYNQQTGRIEYEKTSPLSEDLRKRARMSLSGAKNSFNDYFINNIVLHSDGGYTLSAEVLYTSNYGNMWDRWGYWGYGYPYYGYGPYNWYGWYGGGYWGGWGRYWSPYYYYSPFFYRSYWWGNPWYGYGWEQNQYHADNVALLSFDKDGNKEWDNIIIKRQSGSSTDGTISYQIMQRGDNMHFLLNKAAKFSKLEDVEVQRNGIMLDHELTAAKDKNTDFMPRYARQISSNEAVIPVLLKKSIAFAKIKF
jgi:hypothetical protein